MPTKIKSGVTCSPLTLVERLVALMRQPATSALRLQSTTTPVCTSPMASVIAKAMSSTSVVFAEVKGKTWTWTAFVTTSTIALVNTICVENAMAPMIAWVA